MAQVLIYKNDFSFVLPPDGTQYLILGPFSPFRHGAITVTAHPYPTALTSSRRYMEVIQMATRYSNVDPDAGFWLDIVVRNNGHVGTGADGINGFSIYTSVIIRDQDIV
jgi:hypothetical protein